MENQYENPEQIATQLFINRVQALTRKDDFKEYSDRLRLIHTKRRELFLKLLALGYSLKESSILLARLEVAAADLNADNLAEWTPERILELIAKLNLKF